MDKQSALKKSKYKLKKPGYTHFVQWEWTHVDNKTLGRAQDLRANSSWLSKLPEWNMKSLS